MIRTEKEYQEALKRFKEDRIVAEQQRQELIEEGLCPEEIQTAMEPLMSFQAQLTEEITWYENVKRGNFSPTKRLTHVGRLLIAARIARGWTQRQLADALNVSEAAVSRDERNEYHGITLERAQRIFDMLGVDVVTTLENVPAPNHDTHQSHLEEQKLQLTEAIVNGEACLN